MEKFTPTQWVRESQIDEMYVRIRSTLMPVQTIALVIAPNEKENANLIAAAPDMYKALEAALIELKAAKAVMHSNEYAKKDIEDVIDKVNAALAKANPDEEFYNDTH